MFEVLADHITAEEFLLMVEDGTVPSGARVELLDGQLIDMLPIGPFHGTIVGWLVDHLPLASRGRWVSRCQCALALSESSVPQPDYMLLRPPQGRYKKALPKPADVFLLIEVSDSSLGTDKVEKVPLYAKAGIEEVWLINVRHLAVEIYRKPTPTGYAAQSTVKIGGTVSPLCFPDVVLKTAEIFDEE